MTHAKPTLDAKVHECRRLIRRQLLKDAENRTVEETREESKRSLTIELIWRRCWKREWWSDGESIRNLISEKWEKYNRDWEVVPTYQEYAFMSLPTFALKINYTIQKFKHNHRMSPKTRGGYLKMMTKTNLM